MTNKIKLTKEKIAVSEMLIKKLEFDINDRNILTSEMLRQMIVKCQNLIISDFLKLIFTSFILKLNRFYRRFFCVINYLLLLIVKFLSLIKGVRGTSVYFLTSNKPLDAFFSRFKELLSRSDTNIPPGQFRAVRNEICHIKK